MHNNVTPTDKILKHNILERDVLSFVIWNEDGRNSFGILNIDVLYNLLAYTL